MQVSLKSARVNKGLRQVDVANALKVDRKTVGSWERGTTMPNAKLIDPLCTLLGVDYDNIKWKQ
jgi:DNA-binding XRE family transcriptional regulator